MIFTSFFQAADYLKRTFTVIGILVILTTTSAHSTESAVVLMYHRFGETTYPSTNIRTDQFRSQLEFIRDEGYRVIPLQDLLTALKKKTEIPDRAVVLTVDDAYQSVYATAFPLLQEFGFAFTVFVATGPVDQGITAYMTWEQMREMEAQGVRFANHGDSHAYLVRHHAGESNAAWEKRVADDIDTGWKRLQQEFLQPLGGVFAYPYGEYNTAIARLIRARQLFAFGQHSGAVGHLSDPRALPRFPMAEAYADIDEFRVKLASLPLSVTSVEPWDPVTNRVRPAIEVALGPGTERLDELACFVSGQGTVEINWLEPGKRFRVGASRPFQPGRHRVNCTAPGENERYHWFSHPWIVQSTQ